MPCNDKSSKKSLELQIFQRFRALCFVLEEVCSLQATRDWYDSAVRSIYLTFMPKHCRKQPKQSQDSASIFFLSAECHIGDSRTGLCWVRQCRQGALSEEKLDSNTVVIAQRSLLQSRKLHVMDCSIALQPLSLAETTGGGLNGPLLELA